MLTNVTSNEQGNFKL
ncbi:hypothetical protein AVEN_1711-1, partial [Araneus ventricosus]